MLSFLQVGSLEKLVEGATVTGHFLITQEHVLGPSAQVSAAKTLVKTQSFVHMQTTDVIHHFTPPGSQPQYAGFLLQSRLSQLTVPNPKINHRTKSPADKGLTSLKLERGKKEGLKKAQQLCESKRQMLGLFHVLHYESDKRFL